MTAQLDFTAEGFLMLYPAISVPTYRKPYDNHPQDRQGQFIDLIHDTKDGIIVIQIGDDETPFEDWQTVFKGRIETQRELQQILRMTIPQK